MSKAIIVAGYEFHMINGKLFITSEENPDIQVALSKEAVKALVEYATQEEQGNLLFPTDGNKF